MNLLFFNEYLAEFLLIVGAVIIAVSLMFYGYFSPKLLRLQQALKDASFEKESMERLHQQEMQWMDRSRDQLHESFSALSQKALQSNSEQFLRLAEANMQRFELKAQATHEQNTMAWQHLLDPIKQTLSRAENQMESIEKQRIESFGVITEQIKNLGQDQCQLRAETQKLSTALRTPSARGRWGELSLRRVIEMAGLIKHCDFVEQLGTAFQGKLLRPDALIYLPDRRHLVVDAKAPMDAYFRANEAEQESERRKHQQVFVQHVKQHIQQLSKKSYWEQFSESPDYVVLFLPGEQFLGIAIENDPDLLQYAWDRQVLLASPSTLLAMLRSVAFGWQQLLLNDNAIKVRDLGKSLHRSMVILSEHVERLDRSLTSCNQHFAAMQKSLNANAWLSAKKLAEYGAGSGREIKQSE